MVWSDTTDPSDTWSDTAHPTYRHAIGHEYGETDRILMGDNLRIGGLGWELVTDPAATGTDITDPSVNPLRHTYGIEYSKTTRIRYGDNVRIGGGGWADTSGDPT